MTAPFLQLDGVGVCFGERPILHDIHLGFAPGTLTALVGPNGAGKSTLLAVASGDVEADAGQVILHDRPIAHWKAMALARERAVMPQDHAVRFAFTVDEVVAMGRLPHAADALRDAALVEQSLGQVEMVGLRRRDVQTLSGGEAARATFARVLTQDTPLLLLDEPTAALDLRHQERTLRAVRKLADVGACVIVVLHDVNVAAGYADRIVLLEQGRVAADGTPDQVLTREHIERVYQQPVLVLRHPQRDVPLVVVSDPHGS
jgi:iron complex transport system ATP-binding protein